MASQRQVGQSLELKAYAGTDPATEKRQYIYDRVPADIGKRELAARVKKLDARALELAEGRRARRKNPTAERPKKVKARTVGEAVEIWWTKHGSKLASAPKVRTLVDNIVLPELGHVLVSLTAGTPPDDDDDRDPDLVYLSEEWERIARERSLKPSVIHRCHGMVGAALRRAGHPIPDPGLPSIIKGESQTPLAEEMAAFLDHLAQPPTLPAYTVTRKVRGSDKKVCYEVPAKTLERSAMDLIVEAVAFLVHTGPRPVEALALTQDRVDRVAGKISLNGDGVVERRDADGKEIWIVEHGETVKRRKRSIVLDPRTAAALNRWLKFQDEMALSVGTRLKSRALVFSLDFEAKEPLSPKTVSAAFAKAIDRAEEAGLELPAGFHLYSMRHFGISQLLRDGKDVAAIAQRFGTSARMIHQTYGEFIDKDDSHLAASLGALWSDKNHTDGDVVSLR